MNEQTTLCKIALSQLHGVGASRLSKLIGQITDYHSFFSLSNHELWLQTGVHKTIISGLKREKALGLAEKQLEFNLKNEIKTTFFLDKDYPRRLKQCADAPIVLYSKGNFDWNQQKILAIVGTRFPTEYGQNFLENLLEELTNDNLLIVSGLAYGIDAQAHFLCLKNNIQTLGILGHGMDRIYPSLHKNLAKKMLNNGGIATEFLIETKPDRENFPMRNRIVAGLCDATVVIESKEKGGSIITAELAFDYNRDVFALPGDVRRETSMGCNHLIRKGVANVITSADDVRTVLSWSRQPQQEKFFIGFELDATEKVIVQIIESSPNIHFDILYIKSGLTFSQLQSYLLTLEMKGIVSSLPGNRLTMCRKTAS